MFLPYPSSDSSRRAQRLFVLAGLTALGVFAFWIKTFPAIPAPTIKESRHALPSNIRKPLVVTTAMSRMRCERKKMNVAFLKVHKAGSTTVMNIFLRFAIANGLNIVLPRRWTGAQFNYLGNRQTLSRDRIVPLPENETYNILCNHVVYNQRAFRSILPADTVYVGILREPSKHFKSAFTYFGVYKKLRELMATYNISSDFNLLSVFIRQPQLFQPYLINRVRNKMSFDLGLSRDYFEHDDYVNTYFDSLEKDLSLMMLMEHFDESLVMMKRLLCWDMKDILYIPQNVRNGKPNLYLSESDLRRLQDWNHADHLLYQRFSTLYQVRRSQEGPDFADECATFIAIKTNVQSYCLTGPGDAPILVPDTRWNDEFQVTPNDCALMKEHEIHMLVGLIKNAWQKYNASLT